uniref:Translocator protein 2 n=1 Tax=Junco hyemalis TaxID=40217 RepID=A0A8C5JIU4_JUNHY
NPRQGRMWAYTVGFTVLPHVGGFLGWFLNRKEIPAWYEKLKKPSWCPVALTAVPPHSYASYLVWNDLGGCSSKAIVPMGLYGAQLVLNWAWPPLFFGAHNLNMKIPLFHLHVPFLSRTEILTAVPLKKTSFYSFFLKCRDMRVCKIGEPAPTVSKVVIINNIINYMIGKKRNLSGAVQVPHPGAFLCNY